MNTWIGEKPPPLPPVTLVGRVVGALRLMAFLTLTALALAVFVSGRYLRHWLGHGVTFHFAAARYWARAVLRLLGLRLKVQGHPVQAGALVANHCSWADIPVLRSLTLLYFVAKSEVKSWPVIGFT